MWWYEDEIKALEQRLMQTAFVDPTCFYGSSSFRLWGNLEDTFRRYNAVNLGFGGSTLAACVWFFDRIFQHTTPFRIVIYAGDNDLGDGKSPEEVFLFYQQLVGKITQRFNHIPVYYVSVKPSISRRNILSQIRYTNQLISKDIAQSTNVKYIDIFTPMLKGGEINAALLSDDGLHLSEAGYSLWENVISTALG